MPLFQGSATALITPFTQSGVDFDGYGRLIDFQLENGTDALVAVGTTGEPATMTQQEKEAVIEYAVRRVNGRVPVIAGTGGNNTAAVIEMSRKAEALGADALLVVTPYYNKATPAGLIAHYNAVADAVNLPIVVYNVPGRTGVNLTPAVMAQLAENPKLCCLKEASGNISQISEAARLTGDRVALYSGDDNMVVPVMALGGLGVISVAGNIIPRQMHEMCAAFFAGDLVRARKMQLDMLPLVRALFCEVNPIPVKTAARLMGLPAGPLRLPLTEMEEKNLAQLKCAMREYGLSITEE